jgi:hypothetical protein
MDSPPVVSLKIEGYGGGTGVNRNGIRRVDDRVLDGVLSNQRLDTGMIDQTERLTGIVRGELTAIATPHGVSKTDLGYSVTQVFAPMPGPNGQVGLFLCWVVTVTLRLPLLGKDPVAFPILIPGPIASDQAFRESAKQALEKAIEMRDDAMREVPAAS